MSAGTTKRQPMEIDLGIPELNQTIREAVDAWNHAVDRNAQMASSLTRWRQLEEACGVLKHETPPPIDGKRWWQ